jgi:hypothetical protein
VTEVFSHYAVIPLPTFVKPPGTPTELKKTLFFSRVQLLLTYQLDVDARNCPPGSAATVQWHATGASRGNNVAHRRGSQSMGRTWSF